MGTEYRAGKPSVEIVAAAEKKGLCFKREEGIRVWHCRVVNDCICADYEPLTHFAPWDAWHKLSDHSWQLCRPNGEVVDWSVLGIEATESPAAIVRGSKVKLRRYRDGTNGLAWSDAQEKHVDKIVAVHHLCHDGDILFAKEVNGTYEGRWAKGCFDLVEAGQATDAPPATPTPTSQSTHDFKVGDVVVLGRHNNREDWSPSMDQYVGCQAKITALTGPCCGKDRCSVDVDGGFYGWRLENLTLVEAATVEPISAPPVTFTKEITMPPISSTAAVATSTTFAALKQELRQDAPEVIYRSAARTANKTAKGLIAKYLVDRMPKAKRRTAASVLAMCFDTEAGTAAVGLVLSLLPTASQVLLGKQLPPKLVRLARECRREGGVEVMSRVMDEAVNLVRLLVDMGEQYLKALPDDEQGVAVKEAKEAATALPPARVGVTASAMFAGLEADAEAVPVRG